VIVSQARDRDLKKITKFSFPNLTPFRLHSIFQGELDPFYLSNTLMHYGQIEG